VTTLFHYASLVKVNWFGAGIIKPLPAAPQGVVLEARGVASYRFEPIDPGPDNTVAFRLTKQAGQGDVYDVARDRFGLVTCDCGDYLFRRKGVTAIPCKHGKMLIDAGLIAPPSPAPIADVYPDEPEPTEAVSESYARRLVMPFTVRDAEAWAELSNLPALCGGSPEAEPAALPPLSDTLDLAEARLADLMANLARLERAVRGLDGCGCDHHGAGAFLGHDA
jgi:hypothetical protein